MDYKSENIETVEKIRELCKNQRISLTILEESLGFANGSIGKWAKSTRLPNLNRLVMIANYFGVSIDYLRFGAKEKPATDDGSGYDRKALIMQLWDALDDSGKAALLADAKALASNRTQKDSH